MANSFSTSASVGSTKSACPGSCLIVHLHVDANRDGNVDDDFQKNAQWDRKSGAIILCNNDNDDNDSAKLVDYTNSIIDTAVDESDIAPLDVRIQKPMGTVPFGWKIFLEVSDETKIRIFDQRVAGGKEIIGPTKGKRFQIPDLSPNKLEYGMEAIQYPGPDWKNDFTNDPDTNTIFNGIITISLTVENDSKKVVHSEVAKVRVAPWIMPNHTDPTEEVYVVETDADFLTELDRAVSTPKPKRFISSDQWMQDVMEIGFSSKPNSGTKTSWHLPVVLRTANNRKRMWGGDLDTYPKLHMLGPGFGLTEGLPPTKGSSLDSFGNLECSPPFFHRKSGKEYKFGRIIYGYIKYPVPGPPVPPGAIAPPPRGISGNTPMQKEITTFLAAQKVQEPVKLDTGWLTVGHVDEFMSFLPLKTPQVESVQYTAKQGDTLWKLANQYRMSFDKLKQTNPKILSRYPQTDKRHGQLHVGDIVHIERFIRQFKVMLAGPLVALDILKNLDKSGHRNVRLFNFGSYPVPATVKSAYPSETVSQLLADTSFTGHQTVAQGYINDAKTDLKTELDLEDSDFIELPVLFHKYGSGYIAYTPGVVNMLVVTRSRSGDVTLCIPKPFGPMIGTECQFEKDVKAKLSGIDVKFIYDFESYHANSGEVHCGTNSKRQPPTDRWWWEQEGI